jgi:hypothetical protein
VQVVNVADWEAAAVTIAAGSGGCNCALAGRLHGNSSISMTFDNVAKAAPAAETLDKSNLQRVAGTTATAAQH